MLINVILNPSTRQEAVSHACCTIANLAANSQYLHSSSSSAAAVPFHRPPSFIGTEDSQTTLAAQEKLFLALRLAVEKHGDVEIMRHVARGLANFALYEANAPKLIPLIPLLVTLGQVEAGDTQKHIARAIDNLLIAEGQDMRPYLREAKVDELLRTLAAVLNKPPGDDTAKRAQSALDKLNSEHEDTGEHMKWSAMDGHDGMTIAVAMTASTTNSALQSREGSLDDLHRLSFVSDSQSAAISTESAAHEERKEEDREEVVEDQEETGE